MFNTKGRIIISATGIIFLFMIISSCMFSKKTANNFLMESYNKSFDMIIVPGVPFYTTGWDRTMKGRIYWSKYLYDKGIAKNIMYSGSSVYTPYNEAEIMALYAVALGIPKEHILTETKAEHSTENIYYSYKKSRKLGFQTIALATDRYQAKMLKKFAKKNVDPEVKLLPLVDDTLMVYVPIEDSLVIDYTKAYNKDFVPLPSRESFWKRLRGTLGKNIDTSAYN